MRELSEGTGIPILTENSSNAKRAARGSGVQLREAAPGIA